MPDEIRSLDILEAYAKLCHHNPLKMTFKPSAREAVERAFVARPIFEPQESVLIHANVEQPSSQIQDEMAEFPSNVPIKTPKPPRATAEALFGMGD
jgi:hypothetical protein